MALYQGEPVDGGGIRLTAPTREAIQEVETGEVDDKGPWSRWFDAAEDAPDIMYFSIEQDESIVGEIFLHDIDVERESALIGYRVFGPDARGRGIGKAALPTLVQWVRATTSLKELFILTRGDNARSRRLAEAARFDFMGAAREDAERVVYRLTLPRPPT